MGQNHAVRLDKSCELFAGRYYTCKKNKNFCVFSLGSNQYWAGRVYDLCVYFMTGTPEGSTESGFMEKQGIEPATPGLQDTGLSPTPLRLHVWCMCTRKLTLKYRRQLL